MRRNQLSRRAFLRTAAGLSAASLLTACSIPTFRLGAGRLRLALLTDIHLLPMEPALSGMKRALAHAQAQDPPVEAILLGGDCIMDALETDASNVEAQWDAFTRILAQECTLPVYPVIGNHDVWGWGTEDPSLEQDPRFGKEWAIQALDLPGRYYAFEIGEWQ
ncbi:MAG: metallophosphoesterase, partial [Oricola sp.]